jgi:hypothetical protein
MVCPTVNVGRSVLDTDKKKDGHSQKKKKCVCKKEKAINTTSQTKQGISLHRV